MADIAGGGRAPDSVGREALVISDAFPRLTRTALDVAVPLVGPSRWMAIFSDGSISRELVTGRGNGRELFHWERLTVRYSFR